MSNESSSNADQDLLARLNALKKSTVSFDNSNFQTPLRKGTPISIERNPARALGADLLTRWKSLGGGPSAAQPEASVSSAEKPEDEKTVEELLADLGPSDIWELEKSEEDQVADLLKTAKFTLADAAQRKNEQLETGEADAIGDEHTSTRLLAIDVSVFKPEPEEDQGVEAVVSGNESKDNLDQEADELLARILDEVDHEPREAREGSASVSESEHTAPSGSVQPSDPKPEPNPSALDLPTTASNLPEPALRMHQSNVDDDLASRFAGLSLPSVPIGMKPSKPFAATKPSTGFTDEEIDTWCIICNDNATLQCIGCDGDLYCTNCWMEGHRGEDAGLEERRHKAVQFVKGKKKVPKRRVMMGA